MEKSRNNTLRFLRRLIKKIMFQCSDFDESVATSDGGHTNHQKKIFFRG